jgi:aminoglycoside phosphotransferase (APT) family kinase protein
MPHQDSLDPMAILASLDVHDASQAEAVSGGADTAIWRVMWGGQPYALRVFRPEQVKACENEVRVMGVAAAGGVTVPEVIRNGVWNDRPALLLSWIAGKTLSAQIRERPYLGWTLGNAFGRTQAAIHRVPIPADSDTTRWIEWAGEEPEIKARLYELPSRKSALIHLDYHPLNVMAHRGQISGVLDWANARVGDPRADFARTFSILRVEPITPNGDPLWLTLLRRLLEQAWRSGYVQAGGKLDDMALFYAWAGAAMIRDLLPRINKPGFWLQDAHLDRVRQWRDGWKQKAGIQV